MLQRACVCVCLHMIYCVLRACVRFARERALVCVRSCWKAYVFVHVRLCAFAWVRVSYLHEFECVAACNCLYVGEYSSMCVRACTKTRVHEYVFEDASFLASISVFTCVCVYVYARIRCVVVCVYVFINACLFVCVCV